jgi:hypothetical protein
MACDTFIKIAQKCQKQFLEIQVEEEVPLIDVLLANINSIVCDLQPQQVRKVCLFYLFDKDQFKALGNCSNELSEMGIFTIFFI